MYVNQFPISEFLTKQSTFQHWSVYGNYKIREEKYQESPLFYLSAKYQRNIRKIYIFSKILIIYT